MQTILGAGGPVGIAVAEALSPFTTEIRLVSRSPERVNPGDELHAADLLDSDQVQQALLGSQIAYLTVGLPYRWKIWKAQWPIIMHNVVKACIDQKIKLVFFDNVYMYAPSEIPHMTEGARLGPVSKKGKVRLQVLQILMKAIEKGEVEALVARAADFYGPGKSNSVLIETVFKNLQKGKPANWLGSTSFKHSFTYTPDAGKATALLGNTADAYGQSWHLPTPPNPPTGKEWIQLIAGELGVEPKTQTISKWMLRLIGTWQPDLGEIPEMFYQYNQDYIFDSIKFGERFGVQPTPVKEAIREVIQRGVV